MTSARQLADEILFPAAMEIDAAPAVPRRYLDALAGAGLYDLDVGPIEAGRIVEALGGGSLAATFVWIQHHSAVRAVSTSSPELREQWLAGLRTGRVRSGIAYAALRRPGPPAAIARPTTAGWVLDGYAPWVTGWGLVDVILVGARAGSQVVWLLIDAVQAPGLQVRHLQLAALQSSVTVELKWTGFEVPEARVVEVEAFEDWRTRDAHGRQTNGYLAIGVAARCCSLLGPSPLDAEVDAARQGLDDATLGTVVAARANATLLAVRAATALVAAGGGKSVEAGQHAARLMRDATFLLVFGQTRDIRAAQLHLLNASPS